MKTLVSIAISLMFLVPAAQGKAKAVNPKASVSNKAVVSLSSAVANYDHYKGKEITISGTVKNVCEKKGCWISIVDGDADARALFKDHSFSAPVSIKGKPVHVVGILEKKEISASMARHFAADEGASMKEQNQIRKPKVVYQFSASKVMVL